MGDKVFKLKFHHKGEFLKARYADGTTTMVLHVEADRFSYTVLMEQVKEDLKYTEIGGIYIKKENSGGWKLLSDDKDLTEYTDGFKNGDTIDFYIDNNVDKEIEPLKQMQPHVVIRPRPNLLKGKKVQQKCTFVTIQEYQKQHQQMKKVVQRSPVVKDVDKGNVRRKLTLENNMNGEKSGEVVKLPQKDGDEEDYDARALVRKNYEKLRVMQMQRNKERLAELNIPTLVEDFRLSGQPKKNKRKGKDNEEGGDEYVPDVEIEVDTENMTTITSKRTKKAEEMKVVSRPKTRSRVNGSVAAKEIGTEPNPIPNSVKSADLPLSANERKLQRTKVAGNGSMAAYLQLRDRQKFEEEANAKAKDDARLNMATETDPQPDTMEVTTKKRRGETRMDRVYARNEKKLMTLNRRFQPVSDCGDKVISELSNFCGTIAKDYVPLTFTNWHQVPKMDKDVYWDIVLDKYIIPEEGRPWVMRTIGDSWRVRKSRVKRKHYSKYDNDNDRIKNKPDNIPLEEFKVLLKYWGDKKVQELAEKNIENRKMITDAHTAGPKTFAQISHNMKLQRPDVEDYSPTRGQIFFKTRKRKEGREYKSATVLINNTEETSFPEDGDSHGPYWLVGRHAKTARLRNASSDAYVQQLTTKIRKQVADEMEEKLNQKVQENLARMLKMLAEANPTFNVNMEDFYNTSTKDDNGTPVTIAAITEQGTHGGASS